MKILIEYYSRTGNNAALAERIAEGLRSMGAAEGVEPDRLYDAVRALSIELVLTAHPTEAARRTTRITSYNVCYTKLLRIIIPDVVRKGLKGGLPAEDHVCDEAAHLPGNPFG